MRIVSSALILGAAMVAAPAAAQEATDNSGFFVGLVAGLDVINVDDGATDASEEGLVYGVTAGYDVDTGGALIGVEVEVSETTIDNTDLDIYGGLRLGLPMDDNDVIYIKGGYTNLDIDFFENLEGFRVGAGVEHSFGTLKLRGEYRYSGYNANDVFGANFDANRHQVMLVLGGKF